MNLVPLYVPQSESEAAVITAMLSAHGVRHLMQGGAFATMYPGPLPVSLNERVLLVDEDDLLLARALLEPFTGSAQ